MAAIAAASASALGSKSDLLRRRKFKICLAAGLLGIRLKMRDAIEMAPQFGFEAVEPATGDLAAMSADQMSELLAEMKQKNLVWGAAGIGTPFAQSDAQYKTLLDKLPQSAAALQRAGVTRVQTWITPGDNRLTYLENFRRHTQRVRDISMIYNDHGVRFGIEYVGPKTSRVRYRYEFIHTMKEIRELVAAANQPNLGLVIDSWHWYNAGESPDDIKALTNHDVVSVHLNDAPAGIPLDQQIDGHRTLPAATGIENIGGFLGALITVGYDGPVAAEPFDPSLRRMPPQEAAKRASDAIHQALEKV